MADDDQGRVDDDRADDRDDDPGSSASAIERTPSARELGVDPVQTLAVVDWISYLHLVIGLLALLAILGLAGSATDSLTKLVIGAVLALALDTPVRALQSRGLPRGGAVGVVCLVALAALSAVIALLGPPAIEEAARFGEDLPATLAEFYEFPLVGDHLEEADIAARSDEYLAELPGTVTTETASDIMNRLVLGIASVAQVLLLTLALLLDGEVLVRRARAIVPEHLRPGAERAGRLVYTTLGRYFAGSLLLAVMNGTYILAVGLILGVPLILLAAIWVMITNLIPQIGGFLGGAVFVTLALTQGAFTGALALVLFVAYMSSENYLIQPTVVGRAVNLSPPTTMTAAIIGGTAAGVPGALVATPVVGSVKAIYMAARHGADDEGDDEEEDGGADDEDDGTDDGAPTPPPDGTSGLG
jgi:putative heme transporter